MHTPVRLRSVASVLLVGTTLLLTACGSSPDVGGAPIDAVAATPSTSDGNDDTASPDDSSGGERPAGDQPVGDQPASGEPADDRHTAGQPADATPASPATPVTPGSGDDEPTDVNADCSAAGAEVEPVAVDELPAEVAALRDFLLDAALRCDEQLLHTAIEESDQFTHTFGTPGDAIGAWWDLEAAGASPYLRMAQVLGTTPALVDGGGIYVWPQVATGRPEATTQDAWDELEWLDDPASEAENAGGYLDWRLGISIDGQWRFFVAGD